jgi:hypothetical protein
VFENRILRRIFGPKSEGVAGGWRRLHNEEFRHLYASPNIIRVIKLRKMRWAGHTARMGNMRNAYNILVGEQEGKRSFGRHWRRWDDNIRMDVVRVTGWESVDWMHLAQDRDQWRDLVNTVMNFRVP